MNFTKSCEYDLTHSARLRHHILLLFSPLSWLSGPGAESKCGSELTAEESPRSLRPPPLGPAKPFMFVFDLKGKHTFHARKVAHFRELRLVQSKPR